MSGFDDLFAANTEFIKGFKSQDLTGEAKKGLAIVTGMSAGDAKILRNAGARVTEDVLRTLILATTLLNVSRILVMPHTDCRMASGTEEQIHATILERSGIDTRSVEIRTVSDQISALKSDLVRIEKFPLLPKNIEVIGAIYNVKTGELKKI
ncbi:MAG: hypothetical protein RLZZ27_1031 [Actinomycetota bacterium]